MAIDQRDVSSTLRFMDDRALQQYAAMHKSDPYIFPLAFQESQNRQRMRMQQQGAPGMQPQPKVADAALAQMAPQPLPEEQGIGALPAGNMQGMADGGIAGYAEGELVARSEPVVRMSGGGIARYAGEGPSLVKGDFFSQLDQQKAAQINQLNEQLAVIEPQLRAAAASGDPQAIQMYAQQAQAIRNQISAAREAAGNRVGAIDNLTAPTAPPAADSFRRQQDPRMKPGVAATAQPLITSGAAPTVDTGRKATGPSAPAVPEQSAAQRYAAMQKEMGMGPEAGADVEWKRAQLAERMRAQSKGELEEFDKEAAARGEAFKGREERLAKREAGLGKQKDENTGLALLEAGLAIMSTPGSLATAIGKGAQAGLKTYGAGLKDLRAAQEKMDDARDQIEEFRRNEANMTAKERRQFKSAINKTETDIEKLSLDAAEKMYGYKREDAKNVFTADTQERLTDKEIKARKDLSASESAARERIAQLPQGNERIATLLGNGDLAKGLAKFTEIQAGKFNPTTAYTDYISKRKEGDTVLTPQEFVTQIRSIQALMAGAPSVSNKPTGKAFE